MSLKAQITEDMKAALRAKETVRLSAVRLLIAAIRQKEIDERIDLDDASVVGVVEKLIKQRKDSAAQYQAANRQDLADRERFEIEVLTAYMPKPLDQAEVGALIEAALAETGASSAKDMGKVMAWIKPRLAGRADMAAVSAKIKTRLV